MSSKGAIRPGDPRPQGVGWGGERAGGAAGLTAEGGHPQRVQPGRQRASWGVGTLPPAKPDVDAL